MPGDDLKRMERGQAARAGQLAAWRAGRTHELSLPSGLNVLVRDVTMTDLMLAGNLPGGVLDIADKAGKEGETAMDLREVAQAGPDFGKLLEAIARMALVDPPLGETPDDKHITMAELSGEDRMAIFQFVNREVTDLQPFRKEPGEPVQAVQPGDGVREATEQLHGPGNGAGGVGTGRGLPAGGKTG